MSRREKLRKKMLAIPEKIRFAEVDALLRYEGFVLFNSRGSRRTYHREDGRVLTVVKPPAKRRTCNPADIRRILEALER